jgi:hypothetical protein
MKTKSISCVSNIGNVTGRYVVGCYTPDCGRSTYIECWGSDAAFSDRAIYATDSLSDAVSHAEGEGFTRRVTDDGKVVTTEAMHATIYDRTTGRSVGKAAIAKARKVAAE